MIVEESVLTLHSACLPLRYLFVSCYLIAICIACSVIIIVAAAPLVYLAAGCRLMVSVIILVAEYSERQS
jgi:hypothetical protein